jgi:rhomboid protease GluP
MLPENDLEFLHAVWTRRPFYTYIFLGVNILIFLLMALAGGTDELTLRAFGVKDNASIAEGQWWRFITPMFIHIGMLHLFFNSYALWIVGPQVEKLYGPARFVILFVLTGFAGVYASYYYHPETLSAGASGAIFGLFGVLLVFGIRYRNSIPSAFKRAVGTGVLPVIVINLFIGFMIPQVDNSAHIAGLLSGALLAAVVPFHRPGAETPSIFRTAQMILLATVVVCFYEVARNYDGPRPSVRNLSRSLTQVMGTRSTEQDFIDAVNTSQNAFESSTQWLQAGRLDEAVSEVDELTAMLLRIMQDQYELIEQVERSGTVTFAHGHQLKENVRAFDKTISALTSWVETNGRRYGIEMRNGR